MESIAASLTSELDKMDKIEAAMAKTDNYRIGKVLTHSLLYHGVFYKGTSSHVELLLVLLLLDYRII